MSKDDVYAQVVRIKVSAESVQDSKAKWRQTGFDADFDSYMKQVRIMSDTIGDAGKVIALCNNILRALS